MTGHPHLKVVEGNAANPRSPLARDLVFALVLAAVLFVGTGGSALSAQTPTAVTAEIEVARPPRETVYFPSQYVNPGREIPEPAPAF